jgi:hypothetical protein
MSLTWAHSVNDNGSGALLYSVQVRLDSGEMAVRMSEMRQWLDRSGFEPDAFELPPHGCGRCGVPGRFFRLAGEAAAFAEAFAGTVVG